MNEHGDLLHPLPEQRGDLPEESFEAIVEHGPVRIERIVSFGHRSPDGFWYDQGEEEWVLVVSGAARLELAGEPDPIELRPGGWVRLPAGCRHRVAWTAPDRPTVWLAVFYPSVPAAE